MTDWILDADVLVILTGYGLYRDFYNSCVPRMSLKGISTKAYTTADCWIDNTGKSPPSLAIWTCHYRDWIVCQRLIVNVWLTRAYNFVQYVRERIFNTFINIKLCDFIRQRRQCKWQKLLCSSLRMRRNVGRDFQFEARSYVHRRTTKYPLMENLITMDLFGLPREFPVVFGQTLTL